MFSNSIRIPTQLGIAWLQPHSHNAECLQTVELPLLYCKESAHYEERPTSNLDGNKD